MVENGKRRRRQLMPEEKSEIFLEVTSQEISQADAARKYGVDVSVIIRLRALAKDAALASFASAKPGPAASAEQVELELLRAENDRLSEAFEGDGGRAGVGTRPISPAPSGWPTRSSTSSPATGSATC